MKRIEVGCIVMDENKVFYFVSKEISAFSFKGKNKREKLYELVSLGKRIEVPEMNLRRDYTLVTNYNREVTGIGGRHGGSYRDIVNGCYVVLVGEVRYCFCVYDVSMGSCALVDKDVFKTNMRRI